MPPADARMIAKLATCTWTFTHNRYMDFTLYKLLWLLKEMLNVELHVAKSKALLPLVKDKLKNSMHRVFISIHTEQVKRAQISIQSK